MPGYCTSKNVTLETLSQSITRANANPNQPGLMWRRETVQRPCVNLHKLDNEAMYRVYCSIPDDHRPAVRPEQPKAERPPRAPKKQKVPKNKRLPQPKALPIIEEQFAWVQCDCCDKWRRLFNTTEDEVPDKWQCSDHPDELTCDMPEDTMDAEEQWDGKVKANVIKISFGGDGAPSVRVVEPESQGTEPADSDDDMSSSHDHSSCGPSNEGKTEVSTMPSTGFTMNGENGDLDDFDDDTGGNTKRKRNHVGLGDLPLHVAQFTAQHVNVVARSHHSQDIALAQYEICSARNLHAHAYNPGHNEAERFRNIQFFQGSPDCTFIDNNDLCRLGNGS